MFKIHDQPVFCRANNARKTQEATNVWTASSGDNTLSIERDMTWKLKVYGHDHDLPLPPQIHTTSLLQQLFSTI